MFSYQDTPLLISTCFRHVPGKVSTAETECAVSSVRTAWDSDKCTPRDVTAESDLRTSTLARFLSRSQQVQNKVTTRFNKLIYILFKDVQCTFCLIQGVRASGSFYLHIYRSQTAVTAADPRKQQS